MRLRKRAIGLLIGAGVLFFLGTNVQAGWLFVLAAMLLGVVITGVVLPGRAVRGVEVERQAPERVHQGDELPVAVTVRGGRHGIRRGVLVHDPFLDAADLWMGTVRAGERVEITTMRIARRRGGQASGAVSVRSSAPFGVAERRRRVEVGGPGTLVLPAIEPLGELPFVRPVATSEVALHTAPRRGQGPEYLGVREYRPGDSMRHVHWASSARTGVMMVRELEQEQTRRLAIVLDASRDDPPSDSPSPLDRVCSAAASIALGARAQGHGARLVLGAPDHGDLDVLSRAADAELLERLALLQADPGSPPLPALVARSAEAMRGAETAVLVFPTWHDNDAERLPPAVAALAESVGTVVAIPIVVASGSRGGRLSDEGVDGLEQRLRAAGAAVHPWRPGFPLDASLAVREVGAVVR
jgi:uncharacterized protein (DUF58 family)